MIKRAIHNYQGLIKKYARSRGLSKSWRERYLARLGFKPSGELEEVSKRIMIYHLSKNKITGKSNQFPILEICKRRSKRIATLKEKRQARDQEILPLHQLPLPPLLSD